MSDDLPEGWARTTLGDTLEPGGLFDGPFGSNLKTSDYTDSGVRVIRLENLSNRGFIAEKQTFVSEAKYQMLTKHTVVAEDVLVGSFVDGAMRVCVLPNLTTKAIAKADCFTVRTRCDIADRRFVSLQLSTTTTRDALVGEIHGATRPRITIRQLRDLNVALPPLPEQRRIVAKVESLLLEVNRAQARLDRVPVILKRFRQAVLAAACSGELTREWRRDSPAGETASELLERLGTHPERPRRIPAGKVLRDDLDLPDLPGTWRWTDLRFLAHPSEALCYGVVQPGEDAPDGVRLVRSGDLHDLHGSLPSLRGISKEVDASYRRSRLKGGEILITVVGANIGTVALAPSAARGFNIARAVTKVPIREVNARYVLSWLRSSVAHRWMFGDAREVARPTLNIEQLETLPVPLPPLDEQAEIVRQVDALFALADAIERRVAVATARAEKLPQAILAKAFAGELVPTEAELARAEGRDYETAAALLARVARDAATGAPTAAPKRRGRPPKSAR